MHTAILEIHICDSALHEHLYEPIPINQQDVLFLGKSLGSHPGSLIKFDESTSAIDLALEQEVLETMLNEKAHCIRRNYT